jgi:V8-like Glu-specific endopeptidase
MKRQLSSLLVALSLNAGATAENSIGSFIIGGQEANDDQFREVISFESGSGVCSGVLVGPRVVLTAAHCSSNNQTSAEIRFANQVIVGTVELHPKHQRTPISDYDMALVLLDSPAEGIEPASINLASEVAAGNEVTLVGYGCSQQGGSGTAGIKRFGQSLISEVRDGQYVTKQDSGSSVCFGDSGGPLYVNSTDGNGAGLTLIGVHVAGNLRDTSYSVRLDAAENLKFMLVFARKHRADICGLTIDCSPIHAQE